MLPVQCSCQRSFDWPVGFSELWHFTQTFINCLGK